MPSRSITSRANTTFQGLIHTNAEQIGKFLAVAPKLVKNGQYMPSYKYLDVGLIHIKQWCKRMFADFSLSERDKMCLSKNICLNLDSI